MIWNGTYYRFWWNKNPQKSDRRKNDAKCINRILGTISKDFKREGFGLEGNIEKNKKKTWISTFIWKSSGFLTVVDYRKKSHGIPIPNNSKNENTTIKI